ncbi:MAG: M48 family metallopeptidase [Deltaproteobacteria bacterium]|nr:M48 family metallopeptidase [Deltaproteobacteria bacterium]
MSILELRTEKERTLFTISLVISCLFWAGLILGTLGLGLMYVAVGAGVVLMSQAMFLAALRGNGVRITKDQLPDLYARIERAASRLQLEKVPEAYLLNDRGFFNAFATRFWGRDFVVLYTELLEACDEEDGSIDFIIGHELGHLALGHLKFAPLLLPSRAIPLLGPAYSRACEYSSDRAGTVAAQRPEAAVRGLLVLAAGGRYAKQINVEAFLEQRLETGNFWSGVVELGRSHPYLPKRVGALLADTRPEVAVPAVERNPMAYVAAPFFGAGAVGASAMALVMVVGMGAAIAIPSFIRYKEASAAAAGRFDLPEALSDSVPNEEPIGEMKAEELEALTKALEAAAQQAAVEAEKEGAQLEQAPAALPNEWPTQEVRPAAQEPEKVVKAKRTKVKKVKAPRAPKKPKAAAEEVLY